MNLSLIIVLKRYSLYFTFWSSTRVWGVTGYHDHFKYMDAADENTVEFWTGSDKVRRGDIILMYWVLQEVFFTQFGEQNPMELLKCFGIVDIWLRYVIQ